MVNLFNLGVAEDFRGPDLGVVRRDQPLELYAPTAELVVEVLSHGDESWEKLPHYAAYDVGEVWMVDPEQHAVTMLALKDGTYSERDDSPLIRLTREQVESALDWPD